MRISGVTVAELKPTERIPTTAKTEPSSVFLKTISRRLSFTRREINRPPASAPTKNDTRETILLVMENPQDVGGGFFGGLLIGYALKKVIKMLAVVVGLFILSSVYYYH
jgi:FUN14 family